MGRDLSTQELMVSFLVRAKNLINVGISSRKFYYVDGSAEKEEADSEGMIK